MVLYVDWGVHIDRVEINDVALPESMKRSMSRQAEKKSTLVLPFPVELLRFLERSTLTDGVVSGPGPAHDRGVVAS